MDRRALDWLQLYRSEFIGPAAFFRLTEQFGDAATALAALPELGRRRGGAVRLCPRAQAEAELDAILALGAELLLADHADFPPALRILEIAPLLIVRGDPAWLRKPAIAVVGARDASISGRKLAFELAASLGQAGLAIVSGLARGVDAAAHRGGLPHGTVAVLAGGIDQIYPPQHETLYQEIVARGCVVSEMPVGFVARAEHFPRRNRLIAGLSLGVLVIEAKLRSGSLITARFGLEQGREIFAVPGSPLDPRSAGPNSLIKQGAHLVETAEDIVAVLRGFAPLATAAPPPPQPSIDLPAAHEMVMKSLSIDAVTVDEILRQCQLSPAALSTILLELELAGRLLRHPGNAVSLRA